MPSGLDFRESPCHPERSAAKGRHELDGFKPSSFFCFAILSGAWRRSNDLYMLQWARCPLTAQPGGCAIYFPALRGFQLLLLARFSSYLRLRAGSDRRSYHPLSNRAVLGDPAFANTQHHSWASVHLAWLRSPIASTESFLSRRRVTRQ